ncbi:flagellar assembly protein FliW [Cytobacillus firmus]|uniref:flagellar assembly protein FliW n=1 Tax=Cytobacillus firmus TaxID=1399 RepID=UPI0018CE2370|nr:flagellar assembly protein FliW [Cytobacillus firmus]MBG9548638.1 flagellar assembly protein FliW [Cytobacillus firmus]MBG9603149.1 flagellar assembly protein FliW [Cytobacillus firmus]MDD9310240.1 flagellar assembly protein FliW [Cytobacillus firmus]MED1938982.1 flagellar assembly protein FliW [Cytobacillus firmus]
MNIQTKYHGETEINPENIITFADGIPSFEDEKKFILLELGEDSAYFVLQSTVTPAVAFLVTSPFTFFPDYQIELSDSAIEKLKIENKEDVAVFGILTVKEPFDQTTINLKGPVIINSKQKLGKQIVLNEGDYHTRHELFQQKSSIGKGR